MPNVPDMFNIEWLETLLATLALISAAVSVHLWIARLRFRICQISPLLHCRGGLDCTLGLVLRRPPLCFS
jgi:hypothetical protein